jgi:hypothetical protein
VAEILSLVTGKLGKGLRMLDAETAKYWAGHAHDRRLNKAIAELGTVLLRDLVVDEKIADWVKFYHEVFGLDLDPTEIKLPAERDGFNWIIAVVKGLTNDGVFEICAKRFKSWRYYDDLDKAVTQNDREPTETYVVRVRDRVGADEEHKDKSANVTTQAGIKGTTILERMLLELWYHWKTGKHLDKETLTICSSSRYADGYVPLANWNDDKFNVSSVHPGRAGDHWRVREIVSTNYESLITALLV